MIADSRAVTSSTAFAAVRTGHDYVGEASRSGAPFVLVEGHAVLPDALTAIVVDDVVTALGSLATHVRGRLRARVVAITGSTGKTLTKDFVAAALGDGVHATPRSYNAELGVPLVVLSCPDEVRILVVELAARRAGEIADLCRIVRPEVGLITGIGTSHVAAFGSRRAIASTKSELLAALPADGTAFAPSDDDFLDLMASSTSARLTTVGPGGHVGYGAVSLDQDGRTHGWVRLRDEAVSVSLPVPGRALVRNAAFAVAVARHFNVAAEDAAARIADARTSAWRMQITHQGGRVFVNDAWNANPTSVVSALRTVGELAAGSGQEAWAVLGEMAELGSISRREHTRVGRLAAAIGYAGVIALGDAGYDIVSGAGSIAHHVGSIREAGDLLASLVPDDAWVLVKASRVVGLERLPEHVASRSVGA
jgi:UDP-N-acetylmuramoyl-tripeptide--D-alanyl-D-alanine ligase